MGDRQTFQVMPSTAADADRESRAPGRGRSATTTRSPGRTTTVSPSTTATRSRSPRPTTRRCCGSASRRVSASLVFDNATNDGGLTLDPETGVVTGFSDVKSGLSTGAGRLFVYGVVDQKVVASGKLAERWRRERRRLLLLRPQGQAGAAADRDLADRHRAGQEEPRAGAAGRQSKFEQGQRRGAGSSGTPSCARSRSKAPPRTSCTTLYSNLYRLFLYPNNGSENTGTARPSR